MKNKVIVLMACFMVVINTLTGCFSKYSATDIEELIQDAYNTTVEKESYKVSFEEKFKADDSEKIDRKKFTVGENTDEKNFIEYVKWEILDLEEKDTNDYLMKEMDYYLGKEHYSINADSNKVESHNSADENYTVNELVKEKTGLGFELRDEALQELLKLDLSVEEEDEYIIKISTEEITFDEFFGVFSKVNSSADKDVLKQGENFEINIVIDKLGFISEFECAADNVPVSDTDEDRHNYIFAIVVEMFSPLDRKIPDAVVEFNENTATQK